MELSILKDILFSHLKKRGNNDFQESFRVIISNHRKSFSFSNILVSRYLCCTCISYQIPYDVGK